MAEQQPQKAGRRGWGEGGLRRMKNGNWRARLRIGRKADGSPKQLSKVFRVKAEGAQWLAERKAEFRRGVLILPDDTTVGQWLTEWLRHREPNIQPSTYVHDEGRIRLYLVPYLGHLKLTELTAAHIREMLSKMAEDEKSPSEREKSLKILRHAIKDAVREKKVASNPALDVKAPKVTREESRSLTKDEIVRLFDAVRGARYEALFALSIDSGMRPAEVFGLHWPEVDFTKGEVFVRQSLAEVRGKQWLKEPKTQNSRRRIQVATRTLNLLREHAVKMAAEGRDVEKGPVFIGEEGGLLRKSNFQRRVFQKVADKIGVPELTPYDLRHTSATTLLANDVNVRVVSERLGHDDIETTLKHYLHAMPSMQKRAVETWERLFSGECDTNVTRQEFASASKVA